MKTQSVQNHSISNKIAKVGASVGAIGSGAYLLKNAGDIFKKNIRNAKAFNSLKIVLIPASFAAGIVLAGAVVGKTVGLIVEKIKQYKEINELKKVLPEVLSEEIKKIKPISVEEAFEELDGPSFESLGES